MVIRSKAELKVRERAKIKLIKKKLTEPSSPLPSGEGDRKLTEFGFVWN